MIAKVGTIIPSNRRLTLREITDECEIPADLMRCYFNRRYSHETCVCAKFVPRLLTDDQREQRQTIAGDLLERSCEDVQFLKNIVTGDESWV